MEEVETTRYSGFTIAVVVFWCLAAGSWGVAFVLHQQMTQAQLHAEQLKAARRELATENQRLEDHTIPQLRRLLDSDAQSDEEAIKSVRAKCGQAPNIKAALARADSRINDLTGTIALLSTKKTDLEQQLARARAELAAADQTLSAEIRDIEDRIRQRTQLLNQRVAELSAKLAALTKKIDALDAEIASHLDAIRRDRIEYETKLKSLLKKLHDLKDELRLIPPFRPRVVGHILGSNMALNLAFIDLGSRHGVKPGMRFSVYPANVVFRPGMKPKATVEVKRVEETRSQVRVVKFNITDPVVAGDLLVNIAFDPTGRKPTFVLVRFLDVDGDNIDDRDDIIRLIQAQGGRVLPPHPDYVDVNTDFILVGEEWDLNDPIQKKAHIRDQPVLNKAIRRSIVRLDINSFLNYIGYPKWK